MAFKEVHLPAGSGAVSKVILRCDLTFYAHDFSTVDAQAVLQLCALRMYSSQPQAVDLQYCRVAGNSFVEVLSNLCHCTILQSLQLPGLVLPVNVVSQSAHTLADTIKKNIPTRLRLNLQIDAQGIMLLTLVIKSCKMLQPFDVQVNCGSHHAIAVLGDILGHLSKRSRLRIPCNLIEVGFSNLPYRAQCGENGIVTQCPRTGTHPAEHRRNCQSV